MSTPSFHRRGQEVPSRMERPTVHRILATLKAVLSCYQHNIATEKMQYKPINNVDLHAACPARTAPEKPRGARLFLPLLRNRGHKKTAFLFSPSRGVKKRRHGRYMKLSLWGLSLCCPVRASGSRGAAHIKAFSVKVVNR